MFEGHVDMKFDANKEFLQKSHLTVSCAVAMNFDKVGMKSSHTGNPFHLSITWWMISSI